MRCKTDRSDKTEIQPTLANKVKGMQGDMRKIRFIKETRWYYISLSEARQFKVMHKGGDGWRVRWCSTTKHDTTCKGDVAKPNEATTGSTRQCEGRRR